MLPDKTDKANNWCLAHSRYSIEEVTVLKQKIDFWLFLSVPKSALINNSQVFGKTIKFWTLSPQQCQRHGSRGDGRRLDEAKLILAGTQDSY